MHKMLRLIRVFACFIARNVAWLALRWLVKVRFPSAEYPREVIVTLSASVPVELESPLVHSGVRCQLRLSPIIILYPGRTQNPIGNQSRTSLAVDSGS